MPIIPYVETLTGPTSFNVIVSQRIQNISIKGKSATVSTLTTNIPVVGIGSGGTVDIDNGQVYNFSSNDSGPLQGIRITVPAGGVVEIAMQIN